MLKIYFVNLAEAFITLLEGSQIDPEKSMKQSDLVPLGKSFASHIFSQAIIR